MPLPLPNLTDLKCAIKASISATVGSAIGGAAAAAAIAHFFPAVAATMTLIKLGAAGAGSGAAVALPISAVASYGECQEQSNEAYRRSVALQQEIGYCRTIEEGRLTVSTLPGGRAFSMSEAYHTNQMPQQHYIDYENCVKKGHIVDQSQLPAPVLALPPAAGAP